MKPAIALFLPEEISDSARNLAVIGRTGHEELFTGLNPARQAARMLPIDALRYE